MRASTGGPPEECAHVQGILLDENSIMVLERCQRLQNGMK